jgi:hypothetical protein
MFALSKDIFGWMEDMGDFDQFRGWKSHYSLAPSLISNLIIGMDESYQNELLILAPANIDKFELNNLNLKFFRTF